MASPIRRNRSSTAASTLSMSPAPPSELKKLIEGLFRSGALKTTSADGCRQKSESLHRIRQFLVDFPHQSQARDAFRRLHGFQALIDTLRSLSGFYIPSELSKDEKADFFEMLRASLGLLSEALKDHRGNRRYFAKRVESGGWFALEQALAGTGVGQGSDGKEMIDAEGSEQLFGALIAFGLDEESLSELFKGLRRHFHLIVQQHASTKPQAGRHTSDPSILNGTVEGSSLPVDGLNVVKITWEKIQAFLGGNELLQNPEIIITIFNFWLTLPRPDVVTEAAASLTSVSVILAIHSIALSSQYNLVALHTTGILSSILPRLFDQSLSPIETKLLRDIADTLTTLGVNKLEDAYFLFRRANTSADVAEYLLKAIRSSQRPPYIQFDLSLHGFSSVELPNLGRTFPPPSSSTGYSFTAWIYIDRFDPDVHTTIFGAFDASQTCFVLLYIEKDTHNIILQTSVTSSRPSVRFRKALTIEEHRWYHIALVHHRPRTTSSSKAELFIDGKREDEVKPHYPASSPLLKSNIDSNGSLTSFQSRHSPVQVFLGTPQDLSSRLGRNVLLSRWSLASAHLFETTLSKDLVAVYYQLGPKYNGNFQDCLGSFQTYEASAALNMLNEQWYSGKEEQSDIVSAIRFKAGNLLPESKILLNISPNAVLDDDDRNNIDESQLIKSLSRNAAKNLQHLTRSGGNAVAINGAIPSINDALTQPHGVAILTGDPIVVVTQSLDDASWRLGGCASIGLKLIELARTRKAVVRAVEILLECVKGNWRNSEAMERENGFSVLAGILRGKMGVGAVIGPFGSASSTIFEGSLEERGLMSHDLLRLVLAFVGYDAAKPDKSVINNPLAYRILLVDFDMWRKTSLPTQKLYYKQFVDFAITSENRIFNSKRLFRMRIVKKMLDALKGDTFSSEGFPEFMIAFKTLVSCNISAETLRSLSLFITYALHRKNMPSAAPLRARKSTIQSRQKPGQTLARPIVSTPASSPGNKSGSVSSSELSRAQIGIQILQMYSELLCEDNGTVNIKKFARTVTNKWLLYLLAEEEPRVVILGAKILARLLTVHGVNYVKKFAEKTGGFVIMRHRLRRWWNIATIWPICFAILFDQDVAKVDFERSFNLNSLLEIFSTNDKAKVIYPEIMPVITAMIQNGLKTIVRNQGSPDSPVQEQNVGNERLHKANVQEAQHILQRSMSLSAELASHNSKQPSEQRLLMYATLLHTVCHFLADIHTKSQDFRDFAVSSNYIQELLFVLFPIIVSSDTVSPETELNSRGSALTFDGGDVVVRPLSRSANQAAPIVRTTLVEPPPSPTAQRARPLRRGSSFILVTSDRTQHSPSSARLNPIMSPKNRDAVPLNVSNSLIEGLLEIIVAVFMDQILERKEFPGFGLFLKVPPGFQEHQAYFESYLLRNALSQIRNTVELNQKLLWEPRILTNMARFSSHLGEAVFEGWFLGGAEPLLDFAGTILDYLQRPEIAKIKTVRLCSQAISIIRVVFLRVTLLRLSELEDENKESETSSFLDRMMYWQTIVLSSESTDGDFLALICYLLYTKLVSSNMVVRVAAASLWRILLVQKPSETSVILNRAMTLDQEYLLLGFKRLTELDNDTFIYWIDDHRLDLDAIFFGTMSKAWEDFVREENHKTEETARNRVAKRREKLKSWAMDGSANEDTLRRHEVASDHWMANIYASEHLKHQRAMQDYQDNLNFIISTFAKIDRDLRRPCGLLEDGADAKWQLDQTEGRNRMRLRILPDKSTLQADYQPKRKQSGNRISSGLKLDTRVNSLSTTEAVSVTPTSQPSAVPDGRELEITRPRSTSDLIEEPEEHEEGFEMVDDPRDGDDGYEDKNRKVMRSLQRGDQVQHVYNISRVVGLEACEGLLILGKDSLYLLDNFFQRSDGEIVNVWQAPKEERDPYLQMIAGRESTERKAQPSSGEHEARHWRWVDLISISKRRFLFRDVAIEVFFADGRSYLVTTISPNLRDELYLRLIARAPHVSGTSATLYQEDSWRFEALKSVDDVPQTLGSKFANVFSPTSSNPATRKWIKGEMSNFHYLMLVNTMAGRTFNDLTQYPVFPWILADYTSEELDLTNPRVFRDLSNPMGCQTAERQAEFRDRYQSFAEMGDHNAPPFHYGTHYSSAMIVTSYLIRLQPFVQSYLLLQGGSFDHADRLFYSIEKAWTSASRDNMTDVRELIPEFFYLPEFLSNCNGYNFGLRQGTGELIDNVALPPWAKGDPKIFVAKHREALESPYVSKHLHRWIDLVFGFKQRGEAALEATNLFHHLSYHGAKNLDNIEDPVERLATIGIIHNFGQTPHQVFQRAHLQREEVRRKHKKLDTAAESLIRLPFPLLESHERVSSLLYSSKQERLLCSAAFRINIPPDYDKYMEWGFADGSARFYSADSRKLIGLFEHLHQGQLSCALLADSRTLITAGTDCTISVWSVIFSFKSVDLQPRTCLFGHKYPVVTLAVSRSFSAVLSSSTDGQVLLWDLNRLEFVRKLCTGGLVECARINDVTGNIMLCRGQRVTLYTLNGDLLLDQSVCEATDDFVASCAFYEGTGNEWLERDILFTGHKRGVVNIWHKTVTEGKFNLELIKRLNHIDHSREEGQNFSAAVTCILPMPTVVYTGDEDGRVVSHTLRIGE
ncbi:MAG: hypothetical protein M1827_004747 [Pycnora praestabilis]|nr:MAG: hypothetical protein M1827_004747 [Pycnora praestabilis]